MTAASRARRSSGDESDEIPSDETLTDRAYRAIEEQIVTLQLAPGAVISEAMLSERLKIGRTPIREAIQRLARERLMVIMPRRGIMVSEVNIQTQLRLLEVRRELERLIARNAARRANDAERAEFADEFFSVPHRGVVRLVCAEKAPDRMQLTF